jgi:anti-sigma factor RsiW
MDIEKFEALIIDYIDGRLSEAEKAEVEQELMRNEKAFTLYEQLKEVIHAMDRAEKFEPSAQLKPRFEAALRAEMDSLQPTKTLFFQPTYYRVAAAIVLLIVGGGIGFWISKYNDQQQELQALANEMKATKIMMMTLIGNQQSASQRIQGVNVAMTIESADDDVVKALIKRMNEDPNTNVRLAALDALNKFHDDPLVRKALIEGLSNQKDPVVQIALIQLMVKMKEKGIVTDLKRIVDDEETMKAVKDEAYTGLLELS